MLPEGIYKYEPLWGEWHIEELIGKGSYGEVYRIYREVDGKKEYAAAKYISVPKDEAEKETVYNRRLATDEQSLKKYFADMGDVFAKETELMMKLRGGSNIVRYESHLKKDKPDGIGCDIIIRMELLTPLEKYLRTNSFGKKDVIKLGIDICRAIESCQKEKIIHRDVKTENIFLDSNGNYKLGDFGVSREAKGTTRGSFIGTEDYMAPEMIKRGDYNDNVDIYALGIVMYRLLNNDRIPFLPCIGDIGGDEVERAFNKRVSGKEEMPNPGFDDGPLAEIIKKACGYDRHKRYSSPAEMAEELEKILDTTDNEIVLKPLKRKVVSPDSSGGGDKTIPEGPQGGGGTIPDRPPSGGGGTIPEKPPKIEPPTPKKKGKVIFAASAAAVLIVLASIFALMPRSVPAADIEGLPEETVSMAIGDERTLTYTLSPENAIDTTEFESSDSEIAEVDAHGKIVAKAEGVAQITVRCGSVEKVIEVDVSPGKIPVTDIEGVEESAALEVGMAFTLYPAVVPENATDAQITYRSSDESIATIGADGVIIGVNPGTVTIFVTAGDITKEMQLTVSAKQAAEPRKTNAPSRTAEPRRTETPSRTAEPAKTPEPAKTAAPQPMAEPRRTQTPVRTAAPEETTKSVADYVPQPTNEWGID